MDFHWITPGELAPGQYVTVLSLRPVTKEVLLSTGEKNFITEEDKNPWIKGTPFRVINVKLPIVMLLNVCKVPNIPPVVFYDTRLVELLEVDEEYAVTYASVMFPPQQSQPPQGQIQAMPNPSGDSQSGVIKEEQTVFEFPPDDDDDKEGGGPPLVPA